MDARALIIDKREGRAHDAAALDLLIAGASDGSIPDYQLSAWLMAVLWRGMTGAETAALTDAMARSGSMLDLSGLRAPTADKHSTGGVGDKTSLVVGPLAAATDLTVAKMSGRGLGHTGGTLDKLESIPGLSVDMTQEQFLAQADAVGLVIAGQSADLAPADKRLYALRDVTGTVPSIPLIAASIMSKKLAAGAEHIALDVKVGRGAFMPDEASARQLAETMVDIGRRAGRRTVAALTRMDQPLGHAVGNALELREAIMTLRGERPLDLSELSLLMTGLMHVACRDARRPQDRFGDIEDAWRRGEGLRRLRSMVEAQGGDPAYVDHPERLPRAQVVCGIEAERAGWIDGVDALAIGNAACDLGAGRKRKADRIDHAVGILLRAKVGDRVSAGATVAEIHAASEAQAESVAEAVAAAFRYAEDAIVPPSIVIDVIGLDD